MRQDTLDLSQPKVFNHIVKGTLFGVAAYRIGDFALRQPSPWNYLIGIVVWLCVAVVLRNLHALVVVPRLELSSEGIRLRYWRGTWFFTLGMFRPWNRVVDVTIPWFEYLGCRTIKQSGGDPWDAWEGFYIDTFRASHEVGWDVFSRSVTGLMNAVNEYRSGDSPVQDEPASVEPIENSNSGRFQSAWFATPVQISGPKTSTSVFDIGCMIFMLPLMLVLFGAVGCLFTMFGGMGVSFLLTFLGQEEAGKGLASLVMMDVVTPMGKMPLAVAIGIAGGPIVFFLYMLSEFDLGTQVLELRAEGLAMGRKPSSMTLIPWGDVVSARLMELTTRLSSGASYTQDVLDIRFRNRSKVRLTERYNRKLADLAELIDPPASKLDAARIFLQAGLPVELAAQAAGLPALNPSP
jgi:hypothetical protein